MTPRPTESCSHEESLGASDSNNQGLKALKSMPRMLPHLVNVIERCSESTRIEVKQEFLHYLDEILDEKVEVDSDA